MLGKPACNTAVLSPPFMKGGDTVLVKGPGLPNIVGYFGGIKDSVTDGQTSGAFYADPPTTGGVDAGGYQNARVHFDASRSNLIYGASDTVQPPALSLIPQIKY